MGSVNSIHNIYDNNTNNNTNDKNCLICWEETQKHNLVECHRCHIKLHDYCHDTYSANRGYTVCPHCQRVGTLGQDLYYKYNYK
jgi:excinuclease UvrABC ATPase subunit